MPSSPKDRKTPRARASGQETAERALRAFALGFPEVHEDFPWGHSAFKVKGKAFLFMSREDGALSLSVKLPRSATVALMMPFAEPTGYGLAKSGWVTARFAKGEEPPLGVLRSWIDESFRTIAPRKVVAALAASEPAAAAPKPARRSRKKGL